MYRIASFNRASAKPARPADVNTPGYFQAGTRVDYGFLNTVQEEIARAIELSGLTLDSGDDEQLYTAISTLGGRTWWRSVCWNAYDIVEGPTGMTVTRNPAAGRVEYVRSSGSTNNGASGDALVIPIDIRGLKVEAANISYQTTVAFDGADVTRSVELVHIGANGTATVIGTLVTGDGIVIASTQASVQTIALTLSSNPIPSAGGSLVAIVKIARTGTTTGTLHIYNVSVQFEEGN